MTVKITRKIVHENEPGKFSVDASELGLTPGEWPVKFETDLGNGQQFVIAERKVEDGDVLYVRYQQSYGKITLTVFND